MRYDMNMHIPQQIETLLHYRSNSDVVGFDYILTGIRTLMQSEQGFIKGLDDDQKKREKNIKDTMNEAKKTILTALNEKKTEKGLDITHQVIIGLEQVFNRIELEYMNNVLLTCKTFEDDDGGNNE